jgi:hypothetical protein
MRRTGIQKRAPSAVGEPRGEVSGVMRRAPACCVSRSRSWAFCPRRRRDLGPRTCIARSRAELLLASVDHIHSTRYWFRMISSSWDAKDWEPQKAPKTWDRQGSPCQNAARSGAIHAGSSTESRTPRSIPAQTWSSTCRQSAGTHVGFSTRPFCKEVFPLCSTQQTALFPRCVLSVVCLSAHWCPASARSGQTSIDLFRVSRRID